MRTAMAATGTLKDIIELEELKKDTTMTRSILSSAQTVLAADELGDEHVMQLVTAVRTKYSSMIQAVQHYRTLATKREKLWVMFHRFSTEEGRQLCDTCDKAIGLSAPDLFWQLLLEREFLEKISQQQATVTADPSTSTSPPSPRILTYVEENAVRYTAGYVIRKLEKKYSRSSSEVGTQCCTALREMGAKLSRNRSESDHRSSEWTQRTDRGSLYHVRDSVFNLFVAIELLVDKELSAIFNTKGKGLEKVKKEKLSWACRDDDVQSLWYIIISPTTIEEESVSQQLLQEIVYLWVTTRGHSKVSKIKEDYI